MSSKAHGGVGTGGGRAVWYDPRNRGGNAAGQRAEAGIFCRAADVSLRNSKTMFLAAGASGFLVLQKPLDEAGDAFVDFHGGVVAKEIAGLGDVGVSDGNVAGLRGLAVEDRGAAEGFFEQFDETIERDGLGFAEVEDLEAEAGARTGEDAIDGVSDEGVVARGGAIAEDGDGFAGGDEGGKFVDGQVGALAGSVYREESQHHDVYPVDVMVGVAEGFAGQFAGGIGGDRGEDRVGLGEWHLGVDAVNGRGGGNGDFADAVEAGGLEQVDGTFDIDALVEGRFLEAGANAGAGGKMDDLVEFCAPQGFVNRGAVGEIAVDEGERLGKGLEGAEVALLDDGRIEVVQVVENADCVAFVQEPFADVGADKPGASGDEKIHCRDASDCRPPMQSADFLSLRLKRCP